MRRPQLVHFVVQRSRAGSTGYRFELFPGYSGSATVPACGTTQCRANGRNRNPSFWDADFHRGDFGRRSANLYFAVPSPSVTKSAWVPPPWKPGPGDGPEGPRPGLLEEAGDARDRGILDGR